MIKFGTGGWRAFIGEEFTKDNVRLVAQAVANITNNESVADRRLLMQTHRYCTVEHAMTPVEPIVTGAYLRAETQVAALKPGAGLPMPALETAEPVTNPEES